MRMNHRAAAAAAAGVAKATVLLWLCLVWLDLIGPAGTGSGAETISVVEASAASSSSTSSFSAAATTATASCASTSSSSSLSSSRGSIPSSREGRKDDDAKDGGRGSGARGGGEEEEEEAGGGGGGGGGRATVRTATDGDAEDSGGTTTTAADSVLESVLAGTEGDDLDDVFDACVRELKRRGAHRCWHKHSTFLQHLTGVHNILRLWGQGETAGRVGLFHSAYSNSYVNLALFDPLDDGERDLVRSLVGTVAERLVHVFCVVDRQEVVVNTLLEQGYIPPEGMRVPHLRDPGDSVYLSPETLRMLVVFTMADVADQYFGWQDQLFGGGGDAGSMIIPGRDHPRNHRPAALWPGISQPGLWMSYVSRLARVANTFRSDWRRPDADDDETDGRWLDVPPVFDGGTELLSVQDEADARDLYWSVVSGRVHDDDQDDDRDDNGNANDATETLRRCVEKNPWAFEPRVLLAQKLLRAGDYDGAVRETTRASELQRQWGTAWDKRMSFEAWVAWTRVLRQRALDREAWPNDSWEVNNLGLVR